MNNLRQQLEGLFEKAALILFTHRLKSLLLLVLFIAGLASNLGRLTADVTTEGFLHKNDPALLAYEAFKDQFGTDDRIIIAIRSETIFSTGFLTKLKHLHDELESGVPYLDDITSLINVRDTFGQGDTLRVEDLCEPFPENPEDVAYIEKRVDATPLYKDLVISSDKTMTALVLKLQAAPDMDEVDLLSGFAEENDPSADSNGSQWITPAQNSEAVLAMDAIVKKYAGDNFKVIVSGTSTVNHFLKEVLSADTKRFLKLAYLAVMIFLGLMFRRISGVLIPILIVTLSLVSVLSLMAITGVSFKLPTQILPSFILAVGVGYSVHILALFFHHLKNSGSSNSPEERKQKAITHAMGHSGVAVVMTALTTAAGLFSFSTSEVAPIAELGLFAGFGVFMAMLITFVLLPPLLSFVRVPKPQKTSRVPLDRFLTSVSRVSTSRPIMVLTLSTLLFAGALAGIPRLDFSHDVLRWLPETDIIRMDTETIDRDFGGTIAMEIVMDTGKENGLYDPALMAKIDAAARKIDAIETDNVATGKVWSLMEILKETNRALHGNETAYYSLPTTRELTAQELLLFENSGSDDLEDFTDSRFSKARISVKLPFIDAISYSHYIDRVNATLAEELPGVSVTTTGMIMIYSRVIAAGIKSMRISYLYAFATISVLMILLLGNVRIGLISMIPNLLPIVVILGISGWLKIPVSLFIMLIGNIAMGLAVDDTIHFMHNFRKYFDETGDSELAVRKTLLTAGRPMIVTSIVLSLGFFIYLFSAMNHLTHFGLLTGTAIALALLADFFVAPALVTVIYGRTAKKSVSAMAKVSIIFALSLMTPLMTEKAHAADEPRARAIMETVDARDDGDDMQAKMTMVLIDKSGHQRLRQLKSISRDEGEDTWSALFFLSPVDVRDTAFLSHDIAHTQDDDQWLYLPALHKAKRIASDDKTSSFMGSDLSYADMTDRELESYDFSLMKEMEVRGNACWVINAMPRTQKVVDDLGYTRSILFVRQDCHVVVRAIHFVKEGKKQKYLDITKLEKIDGIWTALEMQITTKKGKQTRHRTIIQYADVQYNKGLTENLFTVRQMEKGAAGL